MREPITYDEHIPPYMGITPTIAVEFGWNGKAIPGRALVDSGATRMHVDQSLLIELGCRQTGDFQGTVGAHGTERSDPLYALNLAFPKAGRSGQVLVVGMNLQGRSYQAILGTEFLSAGILHLDYRGENYFEFYP